MARSRNIKPGFFKNEKLVELDAYDRLLFIGLWCLADREGRLENRAKRIKMELFPCDDYDVSRGIMNLSDMGFIQRFEIYDIAVIEICNFVKHQNPHGTEKDSLLPDSKGFYRIHERSRNGCITGVSMLSNANPTLKKVDLHLDNALIPDSLIPDSLIPDSLIPDSLIPDSLKQDQKPLPVAKAPAKEKKVRARKPKSEPNEANLATWKAYVDSYFNRYGTEPVRNAKVNAQIAQVVQRLGAEEAPHVAFYYVTINDAFYIRNMHDVGLLVAKCEAIRTQWATGRQVNGVTARQIENTQANMSAAEIAKDMIDKGGVQNAFIV